MDALRRLVEERGLEIDGLVVEGVMDLRFERRKPRRDRSEVDEYVPRLAVLALRAADGTAVEVDEAAREEFHRVGRPCLDLPLHDEVVAAGDPAPVRRVPFAVAWLRADALVRLEAAFLEALIEDDEARLADVAWERFLLSPSYAEVPCGRAEFEELRGEFAASPHAVSMSFDRYRDWLLRSTERLDADGSLLPEAAERAGSILDAWTERDRERGSLSYWLNRNLEVHSRHRQLYDALIDARLDEAGPRGP